MSVSPIFRCSDTVSTVSKHWMLGERLIFYLAKATLAGRDITTDQYGKYNLAIRKTLEAVWQGYKDKTSDDFRQMEVYLKRVWFSNGIYHHYGCEVRPRVL